MRNEGNLALSVSYYMQCGRGATTRPSLAGRRASPFAASVALCPSNEYPITFWSIQPSGSVPSCMFVMVEGKPKEKIIVSSCREHCHAQPRRLVMSPLNTKSLSPPVGQRTAPSVKSTIHKSITGMHSSNLKPVGWPVGAAFPSTDSCPQDPQDYRHRVSHPRTHADRQRPGDCVVLQPEA